jgi:hypothetical protein
MTLKYSHSVVFSRHIELIKKLFASGWLVQGVHTHLTEKDEEFTMSLNTFRKFLLKYKISKRELKKNGPSLDAGVESLGSDKDELHQDKYADKKESPLSVDGSDSAQVESPRVIIPSVTKSVEVTPMLEAIDRTLAVPATHAEFLRLRNAQK